MRSLKKEDYGAVQEGLGRRPILKKPPLDPAKSFVWEFEKRKIFRPVTIAAVRTKVSIKPASKNCAGFRIKINSPAKDIMLKISTSNKKILAVNINKAINTARSAEILKPDIIKNNTKIKAVITYRFRKLIPRNLNTNKENNAIIPICAPEIANK